MKINTVAEIIAAAEKLLRCIDDWPSIALTNDADEWEEELDGAADKLSEALTAHDRLELLRKAVS